MQEADISRRRGRPRAKHGKGFSLFFMCMATVILILFIITWIIISQKTNKSLHDIADVASEARNLGESLLLPKQAETPPGTSLVECVISTEKASDPDHPAANGAIRITVRHDLSPISSKVFMDLVQAGWFDGVFWFRVLKKFIAQCGIRHKEVEGLVKVDKVKRTVKDEVTEHTLSNIRGTLSFAGGNPNSQQIFVNLGNNQRLDKENSYPFATVDEAGMAVMDKLHKGYKDGQGQVKALADGLEAIHERFPYWSKIEHCQVLVAFEEGKATTTEEAAE